MVDAFAFGNAITSDAMERVHACTYVYAMCKSPQRYNYFFVFANKKAK